MMPTPFRAPVLLALITSAAACGAASSASEPPAAAPSSGCNAGTRCAYFPAGTTEDAIQSAFATAAAGWTLSFAEGAYAFQNELTVGANGITVIGAGIDKTILDFSDQASGSEGIFAQNVQNLRLERFTVKDTKGTGVKVLGSKGVTFRQLKAYWTGKDPSAHGGYGLYPVQSRDVLIEGCVVLGASDSGIYVGQSNNVIVRGTRPPPTWPESRSRTRLRPTSTATMRTTIPAAS